MSSSPRLWMYSPGNSPMPLPTKPILFANSGILDLEFPEMPAKESLSLDEFRTYVGNFTTSDGKQISEIIDIQNCRPLLICGELANPYRLADIDAPAMPIIPVRIENICRTWADNLDPRDANPGVHHVTIASSPGWWELTHITLVEPKEMKKIVQWLDGSKPNTWAPKRLAEGTIRLETDLELKSPTIDEFVWDGKDDVVQVEIPKANGPSLDMSTIIVPINTRHGCYNSRGRILRCNHFAQTDFHENFFRLGSSFVWSDVLDVL